MNQINIKDFLSNLPENFPKNLKTHLENSSTLSDAINEFRKFFEEAQADWKSSVIKISQNELDIPLRRDFYRRAFTFVECVINGLSNIMLTANDTVLVENHLKNAEIMVLQDKMIELKRNGKVKSKNAHYPKRERIPFVFRSIISQFGLDIELNLGGGSGWEKFKLAVDRRNELVHPKKLEHLMINDNDMEYLSVGMKWFQEHLDKVVNSMREWEKQNKENFVQKIERIDQNNAEVMELINIVGVLGKYIEGKDQEIDQVELEAAYKTSKKIARQDSQS